MSIFLRKKLDKDREKQYTDLPVMANIVVMMEKPELDTLIGGLAMVNLISCVLYWAATYLLVKKDTTT